MKQIRSYLFEADGQRASYASYGKVGSRENYADLKRELVKSYGRYNVVACWDEYKQYTKHIYIYR